MTAVHELVQYLTCLLLRVILRVPQRPKVCLGFERFELNSMPLLAAFLLAFLLALLLGVLLGVLLLAASLAFLQPVQRRWQDYSSLLRSTP